MPELSKIKDRDTGVEYDVKDAQARKEIAALKENGNGNNSGGNVELDTTLTQSGKAADAKAVGDKIAEITGISLVEPADDDMPKVFLTGSEFGNMTTAKNEVQMGLEYISKTDRFKAAIKIKFQGNTSLTFPKKNFTIKMYTDDTYEDKLKKSFKNWNHSGNKYVLKANWIDHAHARNIISARLWGEVVASRPDYDSLPVEMRNAPNNGAIDGFPVKLYVNGKYEGVYTWNVGKDDWMWGMDEDNANHVLMCAETNNDGVVKNTPCNFRALWSGTDENNWTVEVGANSTAVKTALNNLIQFVMDNDGDSFRNGIDNYLDIQSAIDYYIFQYEICGLDGLAKNMLLATYDGTRWICGAYDMDATFGLYWNGSKFVSAQYRCPEDYQETYSLLWERIEANFPTELRARQAELRKTVLSYSNMVTHFERFMDVIGLDLFAEDLTVYTGIPSGSTNNIKQIRNFIRDRQVYVDAEFARMSGPVACTGISLDKSTLTFTAEGTQTLIATVAPDGCTDAVTWESNNTSVATVNGGVVTALANGDATITVRCGNYSASCQVAVSGIAEPVPCTGITLDKTELTINGESTHIITATVTPGDTTDAVVWVSSAPGVASITVDGNVCTVQSVNNGSATITVTCGEYNASCDVSVSGIKPNILRGATWHYGTFNGNTGAAINTQNDISTDAVDVYAYAGKNVWYKTDANGGKIGFWDASGAWISGLYGDDSAGGGTVPDNAVTMRLATSKNTKEFTLYFFDTCENLLDAVNAIEGQTYDATTGTLGTMGGYNSKKIALESAGLLVINKIVSGAFFDANDNFVSGLTYSGSAGQRTYEITDGMASAGLNYTTANASTASAILLKAEDASTSIIEIT